MAARITAHAPAIQPQQIAAATNIIVAAICEERGPAMHVQPALPRAGAIPDAIVVSAIGAWPRLRLNDRRHLRISPLYELPSGSLELNTVSH